MAFVAWLETKSAYVMLWVQLDPVWYKSNRNFTRIVSTVYLLTVLIIVFVPQELKSITVTEYSNSLFPVPLWVFQPMK